MTWSTLNIRLQRPLIGFLLRQARLIDGRWSAGVNEQRGMVGPQALRYRWHRSKRQCLDQILDGALQAVKILILSSRRMSLALLDHLVPTGLHEQPNCLRRVEIDMTHRVPDEVRWKASIVFQRYFDEHEVGNSRRLIEQQPRMLNVLDHVTQNREIKRCIGIWNVISVELAALDQRRNFPIADTLDTRGGDIERKMPLPESAVGELLQYRAFARPYVQNGRWGARGTQWPDIGRLVDGPHLA